MLRQTHYKARNTFGMLTNASFNLQLCSSAQWSVTLLRVSIMIADSSMHILFV